MYKLKKLPPKYWKSPDCCEMSFEQRIAARRYLDSCFNTKVRYAYLAAFAGVSAIIPRTTGFLRFALIAELTCKSYKFFKTSPLFSYGKHQALQMLNYHLQVREQREEHLRDLQLFRSQNAEKVQEFNQKFGGSMSPVDVMNFYLKHAKNVHIV